MFELSKQILTKVSFDKFLFKKELKKSLLWLKPGERILLYAWCLTNFGAEYREIITQVYRTVVKS